MAQARVVELVYTGHLKCPAARHAGSSPAPGTIYNRVMNQEPDSKRRRPIGMILAIIVVLSLLFYLVSKYAS